MANKTSTEWTHTHIFLSLICSNFMIHNIFPEREKKKITRTTFDKRLQSNAWKGHTEKELKEAREEEKKKSIGAHMK